jgi:hypothetical protein
MRTSAFLLDRSISVIMEKVEAFTFVVHGHSLLQIQQQCVHNDECSISICILYCIFFKKIFIIYFSKKEKCRT